MSIEEFGQKTMQRAVTGSLHGLDGEDTMKQCRNWAGAARSVRLNPDIIMRASPVFQIAQPNLCSGSASYGSCKSGALHTSMQMLLLGYSYSTWQRRQPVPVKLDTGQLTNAMWTPVVILPVQAGFAMIPNISHDYDPVGRSDDKV